MPCRQISWRRFLNEGPSFKIICVKMIQNYVVQLHYGVWFWHVNGGQKELCDASSLLSALWIVCKKFITSHLQSRCLYLLSQLLTFNICSYLDRNNP